MTQNNERGLQYADNIIDNILSFNVASTWTAVGTGSGSVDTNEFFEGSGSLKINNTDYKNTDLTVSNSVQSSVVPIDGNYDFSLYLKKTLAEDMSIDLQIFKGASQIYGESIDANQIITFSADDVDNWTSFITNESFSLSKGEVITFVVKLKKNASSAFSSVNLWLDGLMLYNKERNQIEAPIYSKPIQEQASIPSNFVQVNSASDLPSPSSGIINLVDGYTYKFNGDIDLLGDRIVSNDAVVNIFGNSSETSSLTSTGLGAGIPLITSNTTIKLGNITIQNVDTALSLTKSTVMAIDWDGVNFVNIPNLGTVDSPDNFIFTKGSLFNSNGLLFDGTIGTIGVDNSLLSGDGNAGNLIEIASTAIITRRFRITYSAVVITGSTVGIDVDASATIPDEAYILDTVNFSGGGTYLDGISVTDNKTAFTNCVGIQNSAEISQYYMNGNVTATTISVISTPVKVSGTTTSSTLTQKFTNTDNRATYEGSRTRIFKVVATLSLESGNTNQIGVYLAKNGTISAESEVYGTTSGTGRAENIVVQTLFELSTSDYVEVFVENSTATNNITVTDLNLILI